MKHERSTEAPMDYEWTNRANTKAAWALPSNNLNTPQKRPYEDFASSTATTSTSAEPTFGSNQNFPFLFPQGGRTFTPHTWTPPALNPSTNPFIPPTTQEIRDVDMSDASPGKAEENKEIGRPMALGGLKRIYGQRQKAKLRRKQRQEGHSDDDIDEDTGPNSTTHNTSNHYTLNLPAPSVSQPDTPYILLGYLQFCFNLSLILLFLYLVVQFVLTVQRDVQQRISEYSTKIVQEITICALQHKTNLCSTNPIPAMVQQCTAWETCMSRDPTVVGRAKVGAELIAEVVNGFVEPISWKTLIFLLTSLSFLTVFINTFLSLCRSRYHPITAPSQSNPPTHPLHPFAPHHYGSFLTGPELAWSSSRKSAEEDVQNPTRRRRLEGGVSEKVK